MPATAGLWLIIPPVSPIGSSWTATADNSAGGRIPTLTGFLQALAFLTRLPCGRKFAHRPELAGAAVAWYGCVGAILGIILVSASIILNHVFSPDQGVPAVLTVLLWIGLTGALHLDGLADCGDAWTGGFTAERFLEILKDTKCGVGAITAVILIVLLKVFALMAIPALSGTLALLYSPVVARVVLMFAIVKFPYVRQGGLGSNFDAGLNAKSILIFGAGIFLILLTISVPGFIVSVIGAAAGFALVFWFFARKAGGFTGDIYGALVEIVETGVLVALSVYLNF